MKFFDLDQQISNIGLKAIGITDNQTVDGGLLGWLTESGTLGSEAVTNTYIQTIIPDVYVLFYSVALFVVVFGIFSYFVFILGAMNAYSYVIIVEVVRRVLLGSIAVSCASWILGWLTELSDALTLMFGLNSDIMVFVADMFVSMYSSIFIILGVIGVYATATMYVCRAIFLSCVELLFIVAIICWIIGAIEMGICKSIEGVGDLLMRFMLWGLFVTPVMAICYGIGMGIMMSTDGPSMITMFTGIIVLLLSMIVPLVLFLKFVYNPIRPAAKVGYMAGRFL